VVEVDLARNLATDAAVLAPGGVVMVYARTETPVQPVWELMYNNVRIDFMLVYTMPDTAKAAAVADITAAVREGALTALPGPRFPLADTAAAHDAVESGALGKVLIDVAPPDQRVSLV
jgi:NADPH2:quinone reductase